MAVIYPQPSGVMDRFWITLMLGLSVANGWGGERLPEILPQTAEALRKLKLPGITLNLSERAVDVNATVCLREGLLELVACTQGSKEHESIVSIAGRPIHIHTALLLFGARPGTPALRMAPETREVRWIPVKPAGDAIQVSLVFPDTEGNPQEHPIHRFIAFAQPKKVEGLPQPKIGRNRFPTASYSPVRIWSMTVPIPKNICANKAATSSPSPPSEMSCFVWRNNTDTKTTGSSGR